MNIICRIHTWYLKRWIANQKEVMDRCQHHIRWNVLSHELVLAETALEALSKFYQR